MTEGPAEVPTAQVRNVLSGHAENAVQVGHADHVTIHSTPPQPPADTAPPGIPLTECSPYDLEVHQAADTGEPDQSDVSLPTYVERAHDARLRTAVATAVAGHNALLVLVGGSSTGKTRACWEAVRPGAAGGLPSDWRLWHPINPGRPDAVLSDLPRIAPRTVLWLNESQHYLLTPGSARGEQVAAGLRELLRNPRRGPILVLGTLWPEYWNILLRAPSGDTEDPHAQARDLLTGMSITVPQAFTGGDLRAAADKGDQRIADAVEHAQDGQITQYLAGAPALLERYRHVPAPAQALLTAAMDAYRLGHGLFLSADLLAAAAPGYLTDSQWARLPEDWLPTAPADACALCQGGSSPLVPVRPRPGQTLPPGVHLRLEDYLAQTGTRLRATIPPPAAQRVLEAFAAFQQTPAPLACLVGAGPGVEPARQLVEPALFGRGAQRAAVLLWGVSEQGVPVRYHLPVAEAGDPAAGRQVGILLGKLGRADDALDWYRRAGAAGDAVAQRMAAEHLIAAGRIADATAWLTACAAAGSAPATDMLEHLRTATSRPDGPERPSVERKPESAVSNLRARGDQLLSRAGELAESGDIGQAGRRRSGAASPMPTQAVRRRWLPQQRQARQHEARPCPAMRRARRSDAAGHRAR
ncbi:MAG TPA: hypothetical protein VFX16_28785 [Pseudonocardiaceae bacterium]|nr:hypothetical protein [Pseudonocardiaceae bacterium]